MLGLERDCGMTRVFQLMLNAVRLHYVMKLAWNYSRAVSVSGEFSMQNASPSDLVPTDTELGL